MQQSGTACGNSVINGTEPCDRTAFAGGSACSSVNLRSGDLRCTDSCTLDTSGCEVRDYCTANNKYGNGECDPCDLLGGMRDPDCDVVCGADGTCGDKFDQLTGTWTCRRLNKTDPDCGMCGNNVTDGNELCDGRAFAGGKITCGDYGFLGGELACKRDCSPDFAACTFSVCGNNTKEGPEVCDGMVEASAGTCEARGFAGGMLTCTSSCTLTERACVRPGCNNSIIETARGEECEGTNLNGLTCMSRGFAGGNLSCDGTCHYDQTGCVAMGCNNMIREPTEECEGTDLQGATCQSKGFLSGTLGCSSTSCTYDTAQCVAPGCGNMVIEAGTEQCEGSDLASATCLTRGFAGGNLTCNSMCQFDTTACIARGCNNMIIEMGEQCEGTNLNGATCTSAGFLGGTLSCGGNCLFDTTACTRGGCGNMIVEPATEQCDGPQLNGGSCQQQGYTGGQISCAMNCRYDTSLCTGGGAVCGDGRLQGFEFCDGNAFPSGFDRACSSLGLGTGNLNCVACHLDFSGCQNSDFCAVPMPSYYGDGACDVCQLGGGMRDPDCNMHCGADNTCAEYYDAAAYNYSCLAVTGARDPDCGCGDGFLEPAMAGQLVIEQCDGNLSNYATDCASFGFTSGTVRCANNCKLDFGNCR